MNIDVLQPLVVRKFSILMNRSYPKKFGNFDIIADRPVKPVVLNKLAFDIDSKVIDKNNRINLTIKIFYHVNWM